MAQIELTYEEAHSSLWAKIQKYAEQRLDLLRARNDSTALTLEQTSTLRGQIKEVKILLELASPNPGVTSED